MMSAEMRTFFSFSCNTDIVTKRNSDSSVRFLNDTLSKSYIVGVNRLHSQKEQRC